MSENYITQICTGPRFTMHSSPMTELSAIAVKTNGRGSHEVPNY